MVYKCISKLLAMRMKVVMPHLVSKNESAFGDTVLLAQSLCKGYHLRSGASRFSCKVDLRKAFDMLNWSFLFHTLRKIHFSEKFISWIRVCVSLLHDFRQNKWLVRRSL